MPVRPVIFDLDGTLLDTLPDIAAAVNHALGTHGLPPLAASRIVLLVGNGLHVLAGRALAASLAQTRGMSTTAVTVDEVHAELLAYYRAHPLDGTEPYPGIHALLDALGRAGVPLGVVSNKEDGLCRLIVRHHFGERFDAVIGMRPGLPAKPDPAMALAAASAWPVPAASVRYVGDSLTDMATARAAGMPFIAVAWGFRSPAELAAGGCSPVVRDTAELARALDLEDPLP
ncbi:MAG: HAD family hydrolase [Bacillota bacterium]|nr:HAD family hydrolase [Bacillota bacterium]